MKHPTMNEDIKQYPCFMFYKGELIPANWLKTTDCYNHYVYQLHHFIRRSVRKNSRDFYDRVEHLQKMILMDSQCNYDLENMGEERFKSKWGIDKNLLVFSRNKWREGFYDIPN
jgi:hypothetical protein